MGRDRDPRISKTKGWGGASAFLLPQMSLLLLLSETWEEERRAWVEGEG